MSHATTYPNHPGAKARDTAFDAARKMAPKAMSLRARVCEAIKERPRTPEEIAARIGEPVMNVRPRTSELAAVGRIIDTGERREAMGGRQAIVWSIAP